MVSTLKTLFNTVFQVATERTHIFYLNIGKEIQRISETIKNSKIIQTTVENAITMLDLHFKAV